MKYQTVEFYGTKKATDDRIDAIISRRKPSKAVLEFRRDSLKQEISRLSAHPFKNRRKLKSLKAELIEIRKYL